LRGRGEGVVEPLLLLCARGSSVVATDMPDASGRENRPCTVWFRAGTELRAEGKRNLIGEAEAPRVVGAGGTAGLVQ